MGEAWFMGAKRRMFNELMTDTPDHWSPDLLQSPLYELASGPGSFGCRPEWTTWTQFFLAQLPTRIESPSWASAYECLVSAFIAHFPDERIVGPYDAFYCDVLATLGKIPMSPINWVDGRLSGKGVISSVEKTVNGPSISCGGAFSAALFLHLKYLNEHSIVDWLSSVFAIRDHIWRIKLILWLEASSLLLINSGHQPSELDFDSSDGSGWEPSWCLKGSSPSKDVDASQIEVPFISDQRRQIFREMVQTCLSIADLDALTECLVALDVQYPGIRHTRGRLSQAARAIARDYRLM